MDANHCIQFIPIQSDPIYQSQIHPIRTVHAMVAATQGFAFLLSNSLKLTRCGDEFW